MQVNLVSTAPRSPAGTPPAASNDAGGGASFANLLDLEQAPPADTAATAAPGDTPQTRDRGSAQRSVRGQRTPTRSAERAGVPNAKGDARTAETPEAQADAGDTKTLDAAQADGDLAHWLAGLQLPPSGPVSAAVAATAPEAGGGTAAHVHARPAHPDGSEPIDPTSTGIEPTGGSSSVRSAPGAGGRAPGRDRLESAGDRAAAAREPGPGTDPTAIAAAANADPAAPRFHDALSALRPGAPETIGAAGAANAAGSVASAPHADATASVQVPLAVPLDDPQFPRALGVQVSVLARDGVQQAELHLNPAEMGPVSVQIVMEGTQARIDFGADAAGTRQLIEHSLPELAAALREAGLTLAGGGVSQHAGGRDASGGGQPAPSTGDGARAGQTSHGGADAAARPLRRSVSAGGIDLYA